MKPKTLFLILSVEATLCVFALIIYGTLQQAYTAIIAFPFTQIATGLRALSLSGSIGNIIALLIYVSVSLLPAIYLCFRMARNNHKQEDLLLVLLSILLFVALYLMINPAYMNDMFATSDVVLMGKISLGATLYAIIIGYIVFRCLRKFVVSEITNLLDYLKMLLMLMYFILIYKIFGEGINGLISNINTLKAGNTEMSSMMTTTYFFLAIRFALYTLQPALTIAIIFFVNQLIDVLKNDRYSDDVICKANQLSGLCKKSVVLMILSYILINVSQLLMGKYLLDSHYTTEIPLFSMLLVLVVLLLSKYFAEGKALKNDNDMFI